MTSETTKAEVAPSKEEVKTIESCVELGKRAFALRKFEEAVEHYAVALELATEKHGESAPENADLLFLYGKALLENAISQAGVMGKEEAENALKGVKEAEDAASTSKPTGKAPVIAFSGDGDDDDSESEDEAVDLFAASADAPDAEEQEQEGEGEDGGEEPEDDFNAAWEVLDLARALYAKQEDDESKLKLADTYIALGDVSLETEKFDQAAADYTAGINLKTQLLPFHSRQIAEAHYRLSMVLDLTPGKLAAAVEHADKALASVTARLDALKVAAETAPSKTEDDPKVEVAPIDIKGKGSSSTILGSLANDTIDGLKKEQIESQIKEFEELKNDLATKVEDLRTAPAQPDLVGEASGSASVQDAVNQALDAELNAGAPVTSQVVNDLSSMVKKKKKTATNDTAANEASSGSKRKADDKTMDTAMTPPEKKKKLADDASEGGMEVE
ncbi:hypothetical protein FRB94_006560 [Tulasnella sp. JGI-2019a]|nr:hypothetical protein FRB93_012099 [Tulasnella sp. JGI-2019a]KAG9012192.1 hypothetical protein FRB94_006560 [Tulasnella sp. JGI-2019a]KAG9036347.1 hypothetical protein FRB95_009269 [Tulasnella sp. JGI-2019a]